MTKDDKGKFLQILTGLSDLYGSELSKISITLYWEALKDHRIDLISVAASEHVKHSQWMPKPSQFLDVLTKSDMKPEERATLAWGCVSRSAKSIGGYASVNFDDPLINATIRNQGGWTRICTQPAEHFESFIRRQFIADYVVLYGASLSSEALMPLQGTFDKTNPRQVETGLPPGPGHKLLAEVKEKQRLLAQEYEGNPEENLEKVRGIIDTALGQASPPQEKDGLPAIPPEEVH
jgi:hypothetical protein